MVNPAQADAAKTNTLAPRRPMKGLQGTPTCYEVELTASHVWPKTGQSWGTNLFCLFVTLGARRGIEVERRDYGKHTEQHESEERCNSV